MTFRNVKWLQLDVNCFAAVHEIENDRNLKIILNFKGCTVFVIPILLCQMHMISSTFYIAFISLLCIC